MLKYKIPQIVTLTLISTAPQLTSTCLHGAGKLA